MLITLTVKNFVLIDTLEMNFDKGLNIITGETGAGKSIMIDALSVLLGERASSDMVRTGEKKAVIEAVFKLKKDNIIFDLLKNNDLDSEDDEIIIRRELLAKGSSRSFLNDSPVKLSLLKTFGNHLVDFHGQHDHQQLLNKESHITILDIPAKIDKQLAKYQKEFSLLKEMIRELNELVAREKSLRSKEDIQRFELEEIQKVNPQINEEADLESELKLLQNSESLFEMSSEVYTQLYSADDSVHDILNRVKIRLENLKEIDPEFTEFLSECKSALISADEIAQFTGSYKDNIEFNPQKIEHIRSRLHEHSGFRRFSSGTTPRNGIPKSNWK
nr:AAA family ATPase [Candidatus Kapabacteria bacterium]